jgi:hypothetical protein
LVLATLIHKNYRPAQAITLRGERGAVSTEELRKAVVHYRALFYELLEVKDTKPVVTQEARMAVHS